MSQPPQGPGFPQQDPGYPPGPGYQQGGPGYQQQVPGRPQPGHTGLPGPSGPPVPAPVDLGLPTEPQAFHQFYRTPRRTWWKPPVTLLAVAVIWFAAQLALGIPAILADAAVSKDMFTPGGGVKIGPWTFLANNVAIALAIPITMLLQWGILGQRPRWLSSIDGGFRWGWFGRCLAVILPIWLIVVGLEFYLAPPADLSQRWYTGLMIAGILLTTPFQAAGEEYLIRGFLSRVVGSYFRNEVVGWSIAAVVGSLAFTALHMAADPWLNVYYFAFGLAGAWLTWRTGGLEAAVALHVVNNMMSELTMPFTDFSNMMDRSVGTADATVLVNVAVVAAAVALIHWLSGRRGLARRTAPAGR